MLIEFNWQAILWLDSFWIKVSAAFFGLSFASFFIISSLSRLFLSKNQWKSHKKCLVSVWMHSFEEKTFGLVWNATTSRKKASERAKFLSSEFQVGFWRVEDRDEDCVKDLQSYSFSFCFCCDVDSLPCTNTYSLGNLSFFDWHLHRIFFGVSFDFRSWKREKTLCGRAEEEKLWVKSESEGEWGRELIRIVYWIGPHYHLNGCSEKKTAKARAKFYIVFWMSSLSSINYVVQC